MGWPGAVIVAVLAAQLLSLWTVPFLPTQDGPVHQEIAAQLAALREGGAGAIGQYYERNPRPEPNWLVYPLLGALARGAGWQAAEKLILSLYLLALPLALGYALGAVRREATFLAVFALPFGANYLVHMGFLNFAVSVPLGLAALGYGLRLRRKEGPLRYVVLATLLLVTCLAHAVSAAAVVTVLCAAGAWRGATASAGGLKGRLTGATRGCAGPLAAALPTLALIASFLAGPSHHTVWWQSPLDLLRRLLFLHVLVSFDRAELVPAVACAALLAGLVALRLAGWRGRPAPERSAEVLAAISVLAALYFALPASLAGGGYLNPRLQLWLLLLLVVWLGSEPWREDQRRTIVAAVAGFGLVLVAMHASAYRRLDGYVEEYVSIAAALDPGSTVLPVSFVEEEWRLREPSFSGYKVRPFEHALGYIASRRPIVDLTEYQADQGYFPIVYRPGVNPYRTLVPEEGVIEDALGGIDWRAYERAGGRVDYIVLWGRMASNPWLGQGRFLERLAADYELVFTSQPRQLAEVYRRRPARD